MFNWIDSLPQDVQHLVVWIIFLLLIVAIGRCRSIIEAVVSLWKRWNKNPKAEKEREARAKRHRRAYDWQINTGRCIYGKIWDAVVACQVKGLKAGRIEPSNDAFAYHILVERTDSSFSTGGAFGPGGSVVSVAIRSGRAYENPIAVSIGPYPSLEKDTYREFGKSNEEIRDAVTFAVTAVQTYTPFVNV